MLEDDGHLVRVAPAQVARHHDVGMIGPEGDVEVVLPGQAMLDDELQRMPQDLTQGILNHLVVAQDALLDVVFNHLVPLPGLALRPDWPAEKSGGGLLLPGAPRAALTYC